jgi:SAM-dependent methyltransferase
MNIDPWLQRWLPLVRERTGILKILELGCGSGADTKVLAREGFQVIALDIAEASIAEARAAAPTAEIHCQDIRDPWPMSAAGLGAVVASLSLHYFAWDETLLLAERIHSVLRPGGVLLCRVNATDDYNHGATGYPPIADHFYSVHGKPKRFFNRDSLSDLFADGWHTLAINKRFIRKYAKPKSVWEVILEREEAAAKMRPSLF